MRNNVQKGFSLLEILVAFSIFAINMGILFQIYSTGGQSIRLAHDYINAITIAQSQLSAIGIETPATIGTYTGREQQYQWHIFIEDAAVEEETASLEQRLVKRHIAIKVSWGSKNKPQSFKLTTLKLFPAT